MRYAILHILVTLMFVLYRVKFLLGLHPRGYINFVSYGFPGKITDNMLTEMSGFLEKLEPGDGVMADKGFLIDLMLAERGCMLYTPPRCVSGRSQQQPDHTTLTSYVAQKRIHIGEALMYFLVTTCYVLTISVVTQPFVSTVWL